MAAGIVLSNCLWFEAKAEEAVAFYTALFPGSVLHSVLRSGDPDTGPAFVIAFELAGRAYQAINAGPHEPFTDALSMVATCDTQDEIDRLWAALSEGGSVKRCGWLKDRFGVSWQIVPRVLAELMAGPDRAAAGRVTEAMMGMVKLDIAALEAAHRG